ncbi:MAG: lysine--tRNA ligase [Bacilli bacterium]|nr:lysine--tRNA ligase [Bacilli bacterium]
MERKLSEQEIVRREKLKLIERPYPDKYDATHTISEARNLEDGTENVSIAGRIGFMRKMGKLSFVKIKNIEDAIQLKIEADKLGEEKYEEFKKIYDAGDFVGAKGTIITTQTGEKSLEVSELTFLGKALRPLPEKFHGLQDTEIKYRERYVDLIMNQDSRELFLGRSKFYYFLRQFMHDNGFLEVETPIVQTAVSGASAKPFFTHHNALDIDCNLRIAPECYLKECNAAGYDRVYEVAKCFRNEGMDPQHLQEFTQIEWYASYWNFEDNIKFFQDFMRQTAMYLKGTTELTVGEQTIDLGKEWNRVNYVEALTEALGFDFLSIEDPEELRTKIIESGKFTKNDLEECNSVAQLIDFCYKRLIRANIFEPTIMWNYPAVLKPLARRNDENDKVVDVFQVIIAGAEICNAYSELVNPEIQRANFEDQLKQKAQGDDETMDLDEDYLKAMEQGMPPISGLGVGIDRLMMLLYNAPSVRDVVLFPMMKPENK